MTEKKGVMVDPLRVISHTADGVFAIDSEQRIILWNQSAQEILGFSSEEALGNFCYDLLPGRGPSGDLLCCEGCQVLTMAKKGRLIRDYDVQVMTKTGRTVWLNVSLILIPGRSRNGPIIVHLFRTVPGPKKGETLDGRVPSAAETSPLTRRETEVLTLLARGVGTREIANRLCISYTTVRTHVQNILQKLQVHNRLEALALAYQEEILPPLSTNCKTKILQLPD